MREDKSHTYWKTTLQLIAVGGLLLFSWGALFGWITEFVVDGTLVPYAGITPPERPPADTWQRQLNDYFDWPPFRERRPAWLSVGVSLVLFGVALRRIPRSSAAIIRLGLGFALSNLLFIVVLLVSQPLVDFLPELSFLDPPGYRAGYGWTYKFIVADSLLLVGLLALQARSIPKWIVAGFPPLEVQDSAT